jgi:tripartite-type tricarboxylate transporter receptor subunit TctC
VPFQGDAGVATGLLGGHVSAGSFAVGGWANHVRAGTMRLLASFEDDRFEVAPNVPTMTELGYALTGATLQHLYGPRGLPPAVVRRLVAAFGEASRTQAYIDIATQNGLYDKNPLVGEALDAYLAKDRAANTELVEKLGLGLKKKP